jgi:RNA polymerase sporulation-specific sigma factor
MTVPRKEGDQTDEIKVVQLVNQVRDIDCETSFAELRSYLSSYISLFEHKYKIPGCDADEIEQECLYALRFKAIEDFNPARGRFRSFAILCMKRHLFSIIKASSQQKRRVLNESLSLDEDRSDGGDDLSLTNLITKDKMSTVDKIEKAEITTVTKERLLSRLSRLEQEVFKLYIQQYPYDEIAMALEKIFPNKKFTKKSVDNALVRCRSKAQEMSKSIEIFE